MSDIKKLADEVRSLAAPANTLREDLKRIELEAKKARTSASHAGPEAKKLADCLESAIRSVARAEKMIAAFGTDAKAFGDSLAAGGAGAGFARTSKVLDPRAARIDFLRALGRAFVARDSASQWAPKAFGELAGRAADLGHPGSSFVVGEVVETTLDALYQFADNGGLDMLEGTFESMTGAVTRMVGHG